MAYKHKIRVSHILDDLEKGYIKSKEEYKQILNTLDKDTFIEYFLEEFDQQRTDTEEEHRELDKDAY